MTSQPIVVWTETPVRDIDAAVAFYDTVLGTTSPVDRSGPVPMATINAAMDTVGCTLFEGEPAGGTILHFAVPELDAAVARARSAGGAVTSEPVDIPPGQFTYVTDPDGNKIGLFEPKG